MFLLMNLSISLQNSFKYSNKGTRFASRKNTKSSDKPEFCGFIRTFGGDEEDRTLDLTDANRTLSQLSYAPKYEIVVGIELNRPRSQLSYKPVCSLKIPCF